MMTDLRIVLAQLNFHLGDLKGNIKKHIDSAMTARDKLAADLIVFPELSLTGYPPEDLLLRPAFITDVNEALNKCVTEIKDIYCIIGHPHSEQAGLFNACSLFYNGRILATYAKQCLPNYGVFDERRYFTPGEKTCIVKIKNIPIGLLICEDLWKLTPTKKAIAHGAKLIISPNASPFEMDKHEQRVAVLAKRARYNHVPIVYVNHIGGQDELVFDGGSMVINHEGELTHFAGSFEETLSLVQPFDKNVTNKTTAIKEFDKLERIYKALVLALHDYVKKNHFKHVLLGLSGGIDSALTLTIAVDALGKDNVRAIIMPSRFTANISIEDATQLATHLGVESEIISIEPAYQAFLDSLKTSFKNKKMDVTEENIQARCRATLLMALSNKSGGLVLTTGNRSEYAVGYCTLYGDMAGGFAVLKDVPKTLVYQLCDYRNKKQAIIPQGIIDRPPTAELSPNQKDEDSLLPYPVLDQILYHYLNQGNTIEEMVAKGFERESVEKIVKLILCSEYKRHQSAIGPHINHKSFGKDWRYPITDGFKG